MIYDGILFSIDNSNPVVPPTETPVIEPTDKFEWALAYDEVKLYWFFNGDIDKFIINYHGTQIGLSSQQQFFIPGFHFLTNPDGTLDKNFIIQAYRNGEIIDTITTTYYEGMTDNHCVVTGNVVSLFGRPLPNVSVFLMPSEPSPIIVNGSVVSHAKALTKTDENGNFTFIVIKGLNATLVIPNAEFQTNFKIPSAPPPYISPIRG